MTAGHDRGLPWHDPREPSSRPWDPDALRVDAARAARALLGARIRSSVGGVTCTGVVVETEAYLGSGDPASHAATTTGVTDRNRAMFGPPGRCYVYRSYGIHWCLNVVTGEVGVGQAVLIRGLEILDGVEIVRRRRQGRTPWAAGPGRVGQALGVDGALDGHDLSRAPLELLGGWAVPDEFVARTGRVGVSRAPEWPLRFLVRGSPGVSRARPHPGTAERMPPVHTLIP